VAALAMARKESPLCIRKRRAESIVSVHGMDDELGIGACLVRGDADGHNAANGADGTDPSLVHAEDSLDDYVVW
jgi:hypothetical protein